jgi:metal-dependent amidase/aminoacylase/carboxypeptidase family protein
MPHQGIDPITIAAQLHTAWQTIVSRSVSPTDPAVISVTQIHAGDTWNVFPDRIVLRGTVHSFDQPQSMGAEDFAFMLEKKPGAYIWIGNGSDADGRNLHSPHYDFNDEAIPHGIQYWLKLAEFAAAPAGSHTA